MTTPNLRYVICNVSCLNDEKLLHCGCSNTCSLFPGSMLYCVCSGCLFWYTENEEFQEERRQRTHIPLVTSFYVFFGKHPALALRDKGQIIIFSD